MPHQILSPRARNRTVKTRTTFLFFQIHQPLQSCPATTAAALVTFCSRRQRKKTPQKTNPTKNLENQEIAHHQITNLGPKKPTSSWVQYQFLPDLIYFLLAEFSRSQKLWPQSICLSVNPRLFLHLWILLLETPTKTLSPPQDGIK